MQSDRQTDNNENHSHISHPKPNKDYSPDVLGKFISLGALGWAILIIMAH